MNAQFMNKKFEIDFSGANVGNHIKTLRARF